MRIAIIPARGGSKRIPRKNIADFHGLPMVVRTIRALQATRLFDVIHVSTDDDEISGIAEAAGADVSFRRSADLSNDHAPVLPVVRWVLEQFKHANTEFSTALLAMPCAPLLESSDYAKACDAFEKSVQNLPLLSVCRYPSPPEWAFFETATGSVAADSAKLLLRSQDLRRAYYDCGLFAFFQASSLLAQNSVVASEFLKFEVDAWKAVDIDTSEDLERARELYELKGRRS